MEGIAEQSPAMHKMDKMQKMDSMMQDRMRMRDENGMSMDDEEMADPAPIGYPFAAPGSLHLYHFTDYTREAMEEQSSTMKKMDNAQKMDKKSMKKMPK